MIVCHCHAVSHRTIDRVIAEGADSTRAVGRACEAGKSCGSCLPEIRRRVADHRARVEGQRARVNERGCGDGVAASVASGWAAK